MVGIHGVILLLFGTAVVLGQQDDEKIPWEFDVTDGSNVTMYCNDTDAIWQPMPGDKLMWKRAVDKDKKRTETEITASRKYVFTNESDLNKLYLTVMDIGKDDYGLYLCTVTNSSGDFLIQYQKGINVNGPLILDLTEKYRYHIITGVVAAAVLFGILLIGCFVYRFRYRPDRGSKSYVVNGYYSEEHSKTRNGFDNPVMAVDDSIQYTKGDIELQPTDNGIEESKTHM